MTLANQEHSPSGLVLLGKDIADSLMGIVEQTHAYEMIRGKKYLRLEAWQFIGTADGTFPATEYVEPIAEGDEVVAYEAKVNLMKDGLIVGSGIMECGFDEFVTQGRTGRAKHNAAKSMAQTRATSKAFRLKYSWVATMAGFQPTTAEEMQGESTPVDTNSENYCAEHNTEWFKKGRMRNYAHKIEGTNDWCNRPSRNAQMAQSRIVLTQVLFMSEAKRRFSLTPSSALSMLDTDEGTFNALDEPQLREAWDVLEERVEDRKRIEERGESHLGTLGHPEEDLEAEMQEPVPAGQVEEPNPDLPRERML